MKTVRALIFSIVTFSLWLAPIGVRAQDQVPDDAIILVMNLDTTQRYQAAWMGTGFLVGEDGLAITNSHIVYPTTHDSKYMLAAVVGHEMYSVEVLCASSLDHNPIKEHPLQYHRDVARIRLVPWNGPGRDTWSWMQGDPSLTYTLHRGELPRFHALTVETSNPSGQVHMIGYGRVSAFPRLHRSEGMVTGTGSLSDGTPYLRMDMTQPAQAGDSGSPVLDNQERVVGVFTWGSDSDGRLRWAQGAIVTESCGK